MDAKVLVAGAGIGGLATALSLHAAGMSDVRIAEAARELNPLGHGLNILPNAVRELAQLGLYEEVASRAIATQELAFYNRNGSRIWTEPRGVGARYRWPQLSLQRSHLQNVLLRAVNERLGPDTVMTGTRVTGFAMNPDGLATVALCTQGKSSSTMDAGLLIGADGVHSSVRATMYPDEGEPPANGMIMWRGVSWAAPFLSGRSMIVAGDDRQRLVCYPVAPPTDGTGNVLINWVAGQPGEKDARSTGDWNRIIPLSRVLEHFGDWHFDWFDVRDMFHRTETVYEYPMIDRDPLPRWTFGRVTLLGDAGHAMYPMGSNGATQAIIDARVLAWSLATHSDVNTALAAYEDLRRPQMTRIQLSNRQQGPEIVITMAHQRAPHGFADIHDVIPAHELAEISAKYAVTGGFDIESVNCTSPYSV